MNITADSFRQTLRRWASGVTIVTFQDDEGTHGLTVSAFLSVSMTPPLVLVSVDKRTNSHPRLLEVKRYGVSILAAEQQRVSNHFAGWDDALKPAFTTLADFPVLDGAAANLVCKLHAQHDGGDHTLFMGEIEQVSWLEDAEPLIYYDGAYRGLEPKEET